MSIALPWVSSSATLPGARCSASSIIRVAWSKRPLSNSSLAADIGSRAAAISADKVRALGAGGIAVPGAGLGVERGAGLGTARALGTSAPRGCSLDRVRFTRVGRR